MKKIFLVLSLMLAFSMNVSAQENKINVQEQAKKDANDITQLLALNSTQNGDFYRLFEMKYQSLTTPDLSLERRTELSRIIEMKIKASLTGEQIIKLEQDAVLYNRLISKPVEK
jgi:hypothetical protein